MKTTRTIVMIGIDCLYREVSIKNSDNGWTIIEKKVVDISRWQSFKMRLGAWFTGEIAIVDHVTECGK